MTQGDIDSLAKTYPTMTIFSPPPKEIIRHEPNEKEDGTDCQGRNHFKSSRTREREGGQTEESRRDGTGSMSHGKPSVIRRVPV